MSWQPPKTVWQVEDVPGVEDFERNERNAEYLKEQVDGLKTGSIKAAKASNAEYATNAGYADNAGKFKKGEVSLKSYRPNPNAPVEYGSTIVTHNFGTTNIIVTLGLVQTSGSIVPGGKYEIIDANRIKITTTVEQPPAGYPVTTVYAYTIFKP